MPLKLCRGLWRPLNVFQGLPRRVHASTFFKSRVNVCQGNEKAVAKCVWIPLQSFQFLLQAREGLEVFDWQALLWVIKQHQAVQTTESKQAVTPELDLDLAKPYYVSPMRMLTNFTKWWAQCETNIRQVYWTDNSRIMHFRFQTYLSYLLWYLLQSTSNMQP